MDIRTEPTLLDEATVGANAATTVDALDALIKLRGGLHVAAYAADQALTASTKPGASLEDIAQAIAAAQRGLQAARQATLDLLGLGLPTQGSA